jgi:hypothetical protein
MRRYLIIHTHVEAYGGQPDAVPDGALIISSIDDLDVERFPNRRLVAIWNSLPGSVPISRFKDRKTALRRLRMAFEALEPIWSEVLPETPSPRSKQDLVIQMLRQEGGATLLELSAATGWQRHSIRGAISGGLKKKLGLAVTSTRIDGRGRVYAIA